MTTKKFIQTILNGMFILSIILFSSCNGRNVNTLTNEKVKFQDLPVEIIHYLRNSDDYHEDTLYDLIELPKGKENNYRMESVGTWIGPWESHKELTNIKKDVYYKIDQGVPRPYIVFENKLYVPDRYNIFTTVDDLKELEFTRYELK
jgi:hypothetical protein